VENCRVNRPDTEYNTEMQLIINSVSQSNYSPKALSASFLPVSPATLSRRCLRRLRLPGRRIILTIDFYSKVTC
jgi:hypothetical protein